MMFSQPRTYSICIGYSISVVSQPEIRANAFGSFEKSHCSARWSDRSRNTRQQVDSNVFERADNREALALEGQVVSLRGQELRKNDIARSTPLASR